MMKTPEFIVVVLALVAIVLIDGAWRLKEIPAQAVAMAEANAAAAVAQSQACGFPTWGRCN